MEQQSKLSARFVSLINGTNGKYIFHLGLLWFLRKWGEGWGGEFLSVHMRAVEVIGPSQYLLVTSK